MKTIEILHENNLVAKFNKCFNVGDKIVWRPHTFHGGKEVTIKSEAFMCHGRAGVCFDEEVGVCGIDDPFVKYPIGKPCTE